MTFSGDPSLHPALRRPLTWTNQNAQISVNVLDGFALEKGDGWPDQIKINVQPRTAGTPITLILDGVAANLMPGTYCEAEGGRTVCDPKVSLQDEHLNLFCPVGSSSFTITRMRMGYLNKNGNPFPSGMFVYNLEGSFSTTCANEAVPITGTFAVTQTTKTKLDELPNTPNAQGTPRCKGTGGWDESVITTFCGSNPKPDVPSTSGLPRRGGTFDLSVGSDKKALLGDLGQGKKYLMESSDGDWIVNAGDVCCAIGKDEFGADVNDGNIDTISITLLNTSQRLKNQGVKFFAFYMDIKSGFEIGRTYVGGDSHQYRNHETETHFELQPNQIFCTGGVVSSFTVEKLESDCYTGSFIPHLTSLRLNYSARCGDQAGGFNGTFTFSEPPQSACPDRLVGGSGGGGGGTGGTGGGTGGDTGGGTGGTGGDTGGTPSTPSTPPPATGFGISLPDSVRQAMTLAPGGSATVFINTFIPADFTGGLSLSATSEDGVTATVTPATLPTGRGEAAVQINVSPNASVHDYRVTVTATADDGRTASSSFLVTLVCDPPIILGIDQPRSTTVNAGASASLSVKASGSAPFTYQWYAGQPGQTGAPVAGANAATFNTPGVNDTTTYWVRVSNACGSTDSFPATVSRR